jgi:tetratricopeptide (TPR) repeat protein
MARLLFVVLLFIPLVTFGQNKSYDFKEAEAKTRRLVYTAPDSALAVIKTTLSQKGKLHDTILGNTYNLYGLYFGMIGNPDSSIYYFKKSLSYIDDYPKNRLRSLMNLSIGYRNKGEYKTSIKILNEALQVSRKDKNNTGVAMAYGEIASNYNYMLEYDKSVNYLLKAIKILKSENNTQQLVAIKQKLANTYLGMENFEFAIDLYKETLQGFKEIGMEKNYYLTHVNIGEAHIRLEQYDEAKKSLQEAASGLEKFGDKELIGITYSKIGNIENAEGQTDKAIASYQKAFDYLVETQSTRILRIGGEYINLLNENGLYKKALGIITQAEPYRKTIYSNIQDRMVYVQAIADTYSHTGNLEKAIAEYRNTIAIKDSITASDAEAAVQEIQAKFQTELQREKNLALEANNRALKQKIDNEQMLMLVYVLGSIALIIIILFMLRGYWLKTKLQKEQLKNSEAENELIKQQHEYEQQLVNSQKDIIEEKQRELTSTTLQMANYQNHINSIIKKCSTNDMGIPDVKRELQLLLKQRDYWKQFETRFNSLHPDFEKKLTNRFGKLTKNDVEFCSLLKLNLTNKEIASLLQISHESAITKKYRIKKKMEIADDEEFDKLLLNM